MGIITNAELDDTGLQIRSWKLALLESIGNVKTLKTSLKTQLENMKINQVDFTEEDVTEMEALLLEINVLIGEL